MNKYIFSMDLIYNFKYKILLNIWIGKNVISLANIELKLWLFRTWGPNWGNWLGPKCRHLNLYFLGIVCSNDKFIFSSKHIFIKSKCIAKWLHSVCRHKYTLSPLKGHNLKIMNQLHLKGSHLIRNCIVMFLKKINT